MAIARLLPAVLLIALPDLATPPEILFRLDYVGMNHSVNQAIDRIASTGMPFSVSVMAVGPQFDEAVAKLQEAVQENPGSPATYRVLAACYAHMGLLGPARETLEAALEEYEGTLIVVSHDRYFLDRVCTRLVVIEGKGVEAHIGNYSDWSGRNREAAATHTTTTATTSTTTSTSTKKESQAAAQPSA